MLSKRNIKPFVVRTTVFVPDDDGEDYSCDVLEDYRKKYDENGNSYYVKVGERSIKSFVGSYVNTCSLESILTRCSLLPVRDKISYLQQESGVSADLSAFPKDGTSAFIMLQKMKQENPDIFNRISKGENINDIINSLSTTVNKTSNITTKKEMNNNGETKSSNA